MPLTPPQTDPEHPRPEGDASTPDTPVTFVPHDPAGPVSAQQVKFSTGRYGELEAHELVHLLDSMEDERSRGRFRESIYISAIFYLALAWFIFYGPRVLWHAPKVKLASDVLRERMTSLTDPKLLPHAPPAPRPTPPPRIDPKTLERLREEARRQPAPEAPKPATPQPEPAKPSTASPAPSAAAPPPPPVTNMPNAPLPQPIQPTPAHRPPPVVAEAPAPQPSVRPNFNAGSASDNMRALSHAVPPGSGISGGNISAPLRGGGSLGGGSEILSDTQGVDFTAWQKRFERNTMNAWLPLLPEEIQPPLSKKGETYLIITILPDGSIGDLKLEASSHDDAINRSCWGSIVTQGKLPPLPTAFHGPNIVIRVHYLVNMDRP